MARRRAGDANPPRWAERLLGAVLKARDRDTITGDLLEEYREVILPSRGRFGARLWYSEQISSFVSGVTAGLVIGAAFGVWIIAGTIVAPLADDTLPGMLGLFGAIVAMFGLAGFSARRRGGSLVDAVKAGATAGAVAFAVIHLAAIVRVNVFLDTLRHRGDWQGLVADFGQSGFQSLRAYANYVYARQILLTPAIGVLAGAIGGALGGLAGSAGHEKHRPPPR